MSDAIHNAAIEAAALLVEHEADGLTLMLSEIDDEQDEAKFCFAADALECAATLIRGLKRNPPNSAPVWMVDLVALNNPPLASHDFGTDPNGMLVQWDSGPITSMGSPDHRGVM